MPQLRVFIIGNLEIQPEPPKTWSFSALNGFEECPLRWALSRTSAQCFDGPVPQKPNRSSVEGTLLHSLLERLAQHMADAEGQPFRPRRTLLELITAWSTENASNPRIDSKSLAAQVRIEEILRAFAEPKSYVDAPGTQATSSPSGKPTGVHEGPECWLRDPQSKLCGRTDLISRGQILDFKSGDQHDQHAEQIIFYGALYVALTGKPPTALRLVYTATNQTTEVPVPTLHALNSTLSEMRKRAAAADRQVLDGQLPPRPAPDKCAYCYVRGLCDAHWNAIRNDNSNPNPNQVIDYAPSAAASIDASALGAYIRDNISGTSSVLHLPQELAQTDRQHLQKMRFLALRATEAAEGVRLTFTQFSEVYIK